MDRRETVELALAKSETLPAGPAVMSRISELCRDPRASARDLGKVLQLDSALTTRVLKQVNSSFYGLSATIKTVTHAVVILGFQEIKHLALSVPVANLYESHMGKPGLDVAALWDRTLLSACFARTLAYHMNHPVPEQVFVAGILADAGMVVLNSILGDEYRTVVESCAEEEFLAEVEAAELGISHIDVGRKLAEKWHFPPDLIQSIARHHDPVVDGQVLPEPGLVCAARRILAAVRQGDTPAGGLLTLSEALVTAFRLDPESVTKAHEKALVEFDAAKKSLASA